MKTANRRSFLKHALLGCAAFFSMGCLIRRSHGFLLPGMFGASFDAYGSSAGMAEGTRGSRAMYYTPLDRNRVRCELCYHACSIAPGRRGFCRNRENRRGGLYNVVYGRPSAVNVDPIEKEPLHHMLPGTQMICIGTAGCNFRCRHCHNWHLSQRPIEEVGRYYVLLPVSMLHGALFTSGCKLYAVFSSLKPPGDKEDTSEALSIARIYIFETVGTIAGGIILTYLFIPCLHSFQVAFVLAMLNIGICAWLTEPFWKPQVTMINRAVSLLTYILLVFSVLIFFSPLADKINLFAVKQQWGDQNLLHYQNSHYGNIVVVERGDEYTFFTDGAPSITTPNPDGHNFRLPIARI